MHGKKFCKRSDLIKCILAWSCKLGKTSSIQYEFSGRVQQDFTGPVQLDCTGPVPLNLTGTVQLDFLDQFNWSLLHHAVQLDFLDQPMIQGTLREQFNWTLLWSVQPDFPGPVQKDFTLIVSTGLYRTSSIELYCDHFISACSMSWSMIVWENLVLETSNNTACG